MMRLALLITTCVLLTDFAASQRQPWHSTPLPTALGKTTTRSISRLPTASMIPTRPDKRTGTNPTGSTPTTALNTGSAPTAALNTTRPNEGALRLVDGYAYYEGRVEMYKEGQWGSVCDWYFDTEDAGVVCRQLGFRDGGYRSDIFGRGNGTISMMNPDCYGYESRLEDCPTSADYCYHDNDVGVICSTYEPETTPSSDSYQYFLMSSNTEANQGIVVVSANYGEQWGIICDIDDMAAKAICSDLGYGAENAHSLWIDTNGFRYPPVVDRLYCPSYYDYQDWYSIYDCSVFPAVNGTCSFEYGNKGVSCNPLGYWHGIPHHIVMAVSIAFSVAIFLIITLAITACCCCCCRKSKTKVITTAPAPVPAPHPQPTKVGVYIPIHETKVPLDHVDQADSAYA